MVEEKTVPFVTVREDFNEYEAENGQILRAKQIVTDIAESEDKRGKKGSLGFQNVAHVVTPKKIDVSNFELARSDEVTDEHIIEELKFKIIKEVINIYETDEVIILVDPRVEKISLTNKKDKSDNPYLRYRTGTAISVIPKRVRE